MAVNPKPPEIVSARKKVPEIKKLFKQQREDILEGRIKAFHEKQCTLDAVHKILFKIIFVISAKISFLVFRVIFLCKMSATVADI